jgi:hypothetical protein
MLPNPTQSQMPDGVAAAKRSAPAPLPPLTLPPAAGAAGPMPLGMPPGQSAPPPAAPAPAMPPGPMGMPPAAMPPAAPPQPTIHDIMPGLQATVQDNGLTLYTLPPLTPGGPPQIIDVGPAPKVPRALQPPKQPKQGP